MALLLKHQSVEEFVSRVREAYRIGERERLVQVAVNTSTTSLYVDPQIRT